MAVSGWRRRGLGVSVSWDVYLSSTPINNGRMGCEYSKSGVIFIPNIKISHCGCVVVVSLAVGEVVCY